MTTFEDAKVGDKVWSLNHGYGKIDELRRDCDYEIIVKFEECRASFTKDGRSFKEELTQSLFWGEVIIVPPGKPLPKLEVDSKVLVWDEGRDKEKRHFSHIDESGRIHVFPQGTTSWTYKRTVSYSCWRLAGDDNCK